MARVSNGGIAATRCETKMSQSPAKPPAPLPRATDGATNGGPESRGASRKAGGSDRGPGRQGPIDGMDLRMTRAGSRRAGAVVFAAMATLLLAACASPGTGPAPDVQVGRTFTGNYLAGRYAQTRDDFTAAAAFYRAALDQAPQDPELLRRAMLLTAGEGNIPQALDYAKRVRALEPAAPFADLLLILDRIQAGELIEAERMADRMDRGGVNALLAPVVDAWVRFGRGRSGEAVTALDRLAGTPAFATYRYYYAALIHDLAGQDAGARANYEVALSSGGPTPVRLIQSYASYLVRTGNRDQAADLYRQLLRDAPESTTLRQALARIEAGEALPRLVPDYKAGVAEALYGVAGLLLRDQVLGAALFYGRLALFMRPDFADALYLVGEVYERAGDHRSALDAFRKIDDGGAVAEAAAIRIADNLAASGDIDGAEALLEERVAAGQKDAAISLAELYRRQERWDDAARAYSSALAALVDPGPEHWDLFYARGVAFERAGRWPEAESDFLKALQLSPDQPLVLNYLGYSWVEKGMHLDRARAMLEKAVTLRPRDGFIVDSLGWALFQMGDYAGAVARLEQAVLLQPNDPTINDHLGDAYWRVGREREARFQWSHALVFDPEPKQAEIIRDKLARGLPPAPAGSVIPVAAPAPK